MVIVKMNNGEQFDSNCSLKEFEKALYAELVNPYNKNVDGYKLKDFIMTSEEIILNVHNISSIQEVKEIEK